jgi:hypothetical protein
VIEAIERTLAPTGTLVVITYLRPPENAPDGPPWPLSECELARLHELGWQEIERIPFEVQEISQVFLVYRRRSL